MNRPTLNAAIADLNSAPMPSVTIVVSPRERFSCARESLLSIIGNTQMRYEMIYIDAGCPPELSDWLEDQAELRGFQLLRPGRPVAPNEARNLALPLVKTRYVVFVDNDVICAPGWLAAMLECAEQEQADLVTPLICHGLPVHTNIHHAGGSLVGDGREFFAQPAGERVAIDQIRFAGRKIADVAPQLRREQTESVEFHCVLARKSLFDRIGPFDEKLLSTREHTDLCLSVVQSGGKIVFEPAATVTYLFPSRQRPMTKGDWHYFLLHWSPLWQQRSIRHFEAKWGLKLDERMASRAWLNWRLHEGVTKALINRLLGPRSLPIARRLLDTLLGRSVRALARVIVAHDDWQRGVLLSKRADRITPSPSSANQSVGGRLGMTPSK